MPDNASIVRNSLERSFDIPFKVTYEETGDVSSYRIQPDDSNQELFYIDIQVANRLHISLDFYPEKYGRRFIESMGERPQERKKLSSSYATTLAGNGCHIDLCINGRPVRYEDVDSWPPYWHDYKLRVSFISQECMGDEASLKNVRFFSEMTMGIILSLAEILPLDAIEGECSFHTDGRKMEIQSVRYERDPCNRKLCIYAHGTRCRVCGMDFEDVYGEIGRGFIHVHHIRPVSQYGGEREINPTKDLIPVCPNCHAMLHRSNPPMLPDNLRLLLRKQYVKAQSDLPPFLRWRADF